MELPLIVEPDGLAESLGAKDLLIIDLCKAETSASTQVPGADAHARRSNQCRVTDRRLPFDSSDFI